MSDRMLPVLDELHDKLVSSFESVEAESARRPLRRFAIGGAVAAAVACTIIAFVALTGRSAGPLGVQEALGIVAAAALEADQPTTDQFVYERTTNRYAQTFGGGPVGLSATRVGAFSALFESVDDEWSNPFSCSYVQTVAASGPDYPTERDKARAAEWKKAAGTRGASMPIHPEIEGTIIGYPPQSSQARPITIGGERLTPTELAAYPTDPKEIYSRIEGSLRGKRGSLSTATHVWNALALAPSNYGPARQLPPALRSGIVLALGEIPGVEVVGENTMPSGERAITFAREESGLRYELTLAKATGVKLESKVTITAPQQGEMSGWPVGTVVQRQVVQERRLVDDVPNSIVKRYRTQPGIFPELDCE